MPDSPVFWMPSGDDEMRAAAERAQQTFRYFWRELAWEHRRIIKGLAMSAVKTAFWDEPKRGGLSSWFRPKNPETRVEYMWLGDVGWDGKLLRGTLLNNPDHLRSVSAGETVEIPLKQVVDWMYAYAADNAVYGAFTVNLMRSRMEKGERAAHDEAWGLDFGDPHLERLTPDWGAADPDVEHPMSENAGAAYREQLEGNAELANHVDADGWTMLHHQALAGSAATVHALLDAGADRSAKTRDGRTAADLAAAMGWKRVSALLAD